MQIQMRPQARPGDPPRNRRRNYALGKSGAHTAALSRTARTGVVMAVLAAVLATAAGPAAATTTVRPIGASQQQIRVIQINPCSAPDPPPKCNDDDDPRPAPRSPAVDGITPQFGAAGDTVSIYGNKIRDLQNVRLGGVPVSVTVNPDGNLATFTVPATFDWRSHNGEQLSLAWSLAGKGGSTTFGITPTIMASSDQYFPHQDGGNRALTRVALARDNGFVTGSTIVDNDRMVSLSVTVSILFADEHGKMIGFTPPYKVTARPCLPIVCGTEPSNGDVAGTEAVGFYNAGPGVINGNPSLAGRVHQISIVTVRNDPNLGSDLAEYLALGKQIWEVGKLLAAFV